MKTKLFVGNLAPGVAENELRDAFFAYGNVMEFRLVRDAGTGASRGFGFVTLSSAEEAQKALAALHRGSFKGRRVIVNEALAPEEWYEEPMRDLGRRLVRAGQDPRLQALLMYAIDFGGLAVLERMLIAGADPNMSSPRGQTPLGRAVNFPDRPQESRLEAVQMLLRAGADPTVLSEGKTPLVIAIEGMRTDVIALFLDVLGMEKFSESDLQAALRAGACMGNLTLVQQLLAKGVKPDPRNASRFPPTPLTAPLTCAATGGHREIVAALVAAGADVNLKDLEGHTALDYALQNSSMARRAIPVLEKAGALPGRPFEEEDDPTRGFAAAAKKPAFKEALAKLRKLTGAALVSLEGVEQKIPGGHGVLLDEKRAEALAEQHHGEFLTAGSYLFFTKDLTKRNGPAIAILPTNDVYRAIGAVGTEGPNSDVDNTALIVWLRELEKKQPFTVLGIGADFLELRFNMPIKDPTDLAKRINRLCPDGDEGPEAEARQAEDLRQTRRVFLWWD
jgi:ankyrin repeat protein